MKRRSLHKKYYILCEGYAEYYFFRWLTKWIYETLILKDPSLSLSFIFDPTSPRRKAMGHGNLQRMLRIMSGRDPTGLLVVYDKGDGQALKTTTLCNQANCEVIASENFFEDTVFKLLGQQPTHQVQGEKAKERFLKKFGCSADKLCWDSLFPDPSKVIRHPEMKPFVSILNSTLPADLHF